jgi:hypothetical protein
VGVEVFGPAGGVALNDASATSQVVAPGGTVAFSAQATGFAVESVLMVSTTKGSARVLSTTRAKASQGILCNVVLHDQNNPTPLFMSSLPVIRKTTQQGD